MPRRARSPSPLLASIPGKGRLCAQEIGTPLGAVVAIADSAGLRLLQFADSPKLEAHRVRCLRALRRPLESRPNRHLRNLEAQLAEYFAGKRSRFSVAVAPIGTPWQLSVWNRLLDTRFGETLFYEDLARDLGRPDTARAVGSAVGANPILILFPCHRILPKAGGLGGYAAAPWRKKSLLSLEGEPRAEKKPLVEERATMLPAARQRVKGR